MLKPEACNEIFAALTSLSSCVQTDSGACITTQCLYPSFDPVEIFIVKVGNGFKVHDGGGASRFAWLHGRDLPSIIRTLNAQAASYSLKVDEDVLISEVSSADWLMSAVLAVANASAAAAREAASLTRNEVEGDLEDKVYSVISEVFSASQIVKCHEVRGKSGKLHRFDFAVFPGPTDRIVIATVSPHHVSVASKFMAFSDAGSDELPVRNRLAVHDKVLSTEDVSLLQNVASLVHVEALGRRLGMPMLH